MTWTSLVGASVQAPVPPHPPPLHPSNIELAFAVAVRVIDPPEATWPVQSDPQLIEPLDAVTVPIPRPDFTTVIVTLDGGGGGGGGVPPVTVCAKPGEALAAKAVLPP